MIVSISNGFMGLPLEEIYSHAHESYPEESCGVVYIYKGRYKYRPCTNLHETPELNFRISDEELSSLPSGSQIYLIVHSHPDAPAEPSEFDLASQKASSHKWLIISSSRNKSDSVDIYITPDQEIATPLYGRQFIHAVSDCYSFVRDFYMSHYGISLLDYPRRDGWWLDGENLYLDNFQNEGFELIELSDARQGDLLLMAIRSDVPNHGAIYLENGFIAHHMTGRLSSEDFYGAYYRDRTTHCLRHKEMKIVTD